MSIYLGNQLLSGSSNILADTMPLGIVLPWFSDSIPESFLLLNGQAVSRSTYFKLFGMWGTAFGAGDGSTTFNVANLKGRVLTGKDGTQLEFDTIGKTGGEKAHIITRAESPWKKCGDEAALYGLDGNGIGGFSDRAAVTREASGAEADGIAHNNLQPYSVCNYIVKALNAVPLGVIDTDGALAANSDRYVPSQKAVKTYIANKLAPVCCKVYHNTGQSINNAADWDITCNSIFFDTDGMHSLSSNTGRITFNTAGYYEITLHGTWAGNSSGIREIWFAGQIGGRAYTSLKNSAAGISSRPTAQSFTDFVYALPGDYLQAKAWQGSGGALTLESCQISAFRMG